MSKKYFSEQEIIQLSKNKNVKKVSKLSVTYSDEFKKIFICEYLEGNLPLEIFSKHGFDVEVLGMDRIKSVAKRWKLKYNKSGIVGLKDERKGKSGRPLNRELSSAEQIKRLEAKIKLLEVENEFLKKLDKMERGIF